MAVFPNPRVMNALKIMCVLACFIGVLMICRSTSAPRADRPIPEVLRQSWVFYKTRMMINGERVNSNHYKGTITEGQSYAMLKAVWMNDPKTFERVWAWTRDHMRRPDDYLFGWRWGESDNGTEQLLETENATDADQDIAYALLLAGEKWSDSQYILEAQLIIPDLWQLNVAEVQGRYYLVPGTWPTFRQDYLTVNPSYFAPYVYRKFAKYDAAHAKGWLALADNTYPVLEACSNLTTSKLPPNWCAVRWDNSQIIFSDKQGAGARDFSYDAFRVFWRMAMDASDGSMQAKQYLNQHPALQSYWKTHKTLPEGFSSKGEPLGQTDSGFALSAALSQRHRLGIEPLRTAYDAMLLPAYHQEGYWFNDYNDYLHSVIWLHLYTTTLP
jgi:endoglucanase